MHRVSETLRDKCIIGKGKLGEGIGDPAMIHRLLVHRKGGEAIMKKDREENTMNLVPIQTSPPPPSLLTTTDSNSRLKLFAIIGKTP